MRYYLDTNILYFILSDRYDEIDRDVKAILDDYSSIVYVSNIVVQELIFLYRIGKFRYKLYKSEKDLIGAIEENDIRIIYSNEYHLKTYTSLQIAEGHKDINDHVIIAQAISDQIRSSPQTTSLRTTPIRAWTLS